jgi:hypothetical protein
MLIAGPIVAPPGRELAVALAICALVAAAVRNLGFGQRSDQRRGVCQVRNRTAPNLCQGQVGTPIGAEVRATVPDMVDDTPARREVRLSAHAAEQYRHRVKPGLDLEAARAELEQLRLVGEITSIEPAWLNAAKPAPHYLLITDALALPLVPQNGRWIATTWIATTCLANSTLTPTRARREVGSPRVAGLAQAPAAPHKSVGPWPVSPPPM